MAVLSVQQTVPRSGTQTSQRKGLLAEVINRTYTLEFLVITSDPNDGPEVVITAPSLPVIGSPYLQGNDEDDLATCTALRCKPTAHPQLFHVEADFDTERLITSAFNHPLLAPAEIEWDGETASWPFTRDGLGRAVVNSSGQRFDPPLEEEDDRPVLRITRNEETFSPANALAYQNAVNSDPFAGAPPFCAKMKRIRGKRQVDIGLVYWSVSYEIHFRRDTWIRYVLDSGFRDASGRLFRDPIDSTPLANTSLLNGWGQNALIAGITTLSGNINAGSASLTVPLAAFTGGTPTNPVVYPSGFPPLATQGAAATVLPDGPFEVKIDNEILQVTDAQGGGGTYTWTVTRGYGGSTAAPHVNGAKVTLQPYYLRFLPKKALPFAPLNLPTI